MYMYIQTRSIDDELKIALSIGKSRVSLLNLKGQTPKQLEKFKSNPGMISAFLNTETRRFFECMNTLIELKPVRVFSCKSIVISLRAYVRLSTRM